MWRPLPHHLLRAALALACVLAAPAALAQAYPAKPLKLVAAFPAGGTSDVIARLLAQQLEEALGKPVVVENHVGSNGMIGEDYVAKSAPDGYTLLLAPSGHAINNSLNANVPYDPIKDFSFITLVGIVPMVVSAGPRIAGKVNNIQDLIALARRTPGEINFGSGGPGSSNQLATELFASMAGIRMTHIPYKGDTPGIADLLGGHIAFIFLNIPAALPFVGSNGKLKALAITSEQRSPLLPNVPALAETVPGYAAASWHGVFAPAGVPAEIIARLNAELVKIVRKPEVKNKLTGMGVNVVGSSSERFEKFTREEIVKWAKVIKDARIKL